ncbi:hypothetical protein [Agrobacterium tumefaciens]|uniref:hypothetical protein n=1 Tax=Agrobacterium tumefaciens TaxID=358 RepID=UPI000EF1C07F|nr:hypothetical protein [Agrobacterium tumefaciens]NSZ34189.1 hypothetical protein [Agrobacterium tumefaciens]QLG23956.1 hypothetical protein EML4_16255 [Agrobacterium tumefaciens]UXS88738.1 hypothetical protein FY144_21260 [Agrobacterium tumefaciens]
MAAPMINFLIVFLLHGVRRRLSQPEANPKARRNLLTFRKRNNETDFLPVRYIYSIFGSNVNAFFAAQLWSGAQGCDDWAFKRTSVPDGIADEGAEAPFASSCP